MAEKTSDWRPGPTVCRCCLAEGCYKDISTEYFWMGKREVYAEMLSDTLSVSIAYSQSGGPNSNSRLICESCISRLRDATDFKRQVLECEKTFMNLLDPGSSTLVKELQLSMEEVKVEHVKTEKASMSDDDFDDQVDFVVENDDDDDDDDLDDEPLMKLASKEPKKEVNITELLKNSQVTVKRKAAVKAKAPPAKKAKKQIVIKPTASKAAAKATASSTPKTEKKKKGQGGIQQNQAVEICGPRLGVLTTTEAERENATMLLEHTTAKPFRYYNGVFQCFYCNKTSTDVRSVLRHAVIHSPNNSSFMKYVKKTRGIVKVDISELKCRICYVKFPDVNDIKDHLITAHKIQFTSARNGLRPFNFGKGIKAMECNECEEGFTSFNSLNRHVIDRHEGGAGVLCEICSLNLSSVRKLRIHMESHQNNEYKCEECMQVYNTKKKLRYHMLRHHGNGNIELPLRCPHCPQRFVEHYIKLNHLKDVHGIAPAYECAICKSVFMSRRRLTDHTKKEHLRTIKCDICDQSFVNITLLRKHFRRHTGKKDFVCAICKRAYLHEDRLRRHLNVEHCYRYVCLKCGMGFPVKDDLIEHKTQLHSKANPIDL